MEKTDQTGTINGGLSATGYVTFNDKGVGGGLTVSGGGSIAGLGAEGSVNVPVAKDGSLVNPIKNTSVDLSAQGSKGNGSVGLSNDGSLSATYGEGIVGGVDVNNSSLSDLASSVVQDLIQDLKDYAYELQQTTDIHNGDGKNRVPDQELKLK